MDVPLTILIVEDHPDIRQLLALSLSRQGVGIIEAADGHAALVLLKERLLAGQLPALLLLDLDMPQIDGELFLHQLCDLLVPPLPPVPPVIVLSARYNIPQDVKEQARTVLAKPFHLSQALSAIQEVLATPP